MLLIDIALDFEVKTNQNVTKESCFAYSCSVSTFTLTLAPERSKEVFRAKFDFLNYFQLLLEARTKLIKLSTKF